MSLYLSLRELLSQAEPVEIRGGKCDLDLVYSSMKALHLGLQIQHVLRRDTDVTNQRKAGVNTGTIERSILRVYSNG